MGDVALVVPVLKALGEQHPEVKLTFISRPQFQIFFQGLKNVNFLPLDLSGKHKGAAGMYRLYQKVRKLGPIWAVADFHDVLRTKLLRTFFILGGIKVAVIDKGRKGKKALTRFSNKELKQLRSSPDRYADVLAQLGYPVKLSYQLLERPALELTSKVKEVLTEGGEGPRIGLAPFSLHKGKMLSFAQVQTLIPLLLERTGGALFLFGGWEERVGKVIQTIPPIRPDHQHSSKTNLG